MSKCQRCKTNKATWAMQYIASDDPTFTALGWHYRGFKVTRLCDDCKEIAIASQPAIDGKAPVAA